MANYKLLLGVGCCIFRKKLHKDTNRLKKNESLIGIGFRDCERDRIRTYDRLLRRQMLYPTELRTLKI